MWVSNADRSPARTNRCDAAQLKLALLSIHSEPEFERLRAELERVEKEQNILCVSNYVFYTWVVKR